MLGKDSPKTAAEIEEAIVFLVNKYSESGTNEKPVIFHSIKVGLYLYKESYSKNIVIAGLLHDLLEDSGTVIKEIENKFGKEVARLVEANSFDNAKKEKMDRYLQTYGKCMKIGKDALVIKAADILDNSYYARFIDDGKEYKWYVFEKMKHFVENTKKVIGFEKVWEDLHERFSMLSKEE